MASNHVADYLGRGTHAARPATPPVLTGEIAIYYETDTTNTFVWTGSAWAQINGGGSSGQKFLASGLTAPTPGSFTWVNQGGASFTANAGGPTTFICPAGSGDSLRLNVVNVPGSEPWTATMQAAVFTPGVNFTAAGLALYDGTKIINLAINAASGSNLALNVTRWNTTSSFSATSFTKAFWWPGPALFFRIYDDATNNNFQVSPDGQTSTFETLYAEAKGAFLTATKVGPCMDNNGTSNGNLVMNIAQWEAVTGTGTALAF